MIEIVDIASLLTLMGVSAAQTQAPAENALLLEGDFSGDLLLEGDFSGSLLLEP